MERRAAHGTTTASSLRHDNRRLHHPITAWRSIAGATELLAKAVETIAPSILATTAGSPEIWLRSPASRAITLGQMRWSRHMASLQRKWRQLQEPAKAPKDTNQPAHT
jgi:hypothetical protein